MPNGTDEQAGSTERMVPLRSMATTTMFRTSAPTNRAIREAIARVSLARPDRRPPSANLVILTALRLAQQAEEMAPGLFAATAEQIEMETFPAEPPS